MTNESALLGLLADLYKQNAALAAEVERLAAALAERDETKPPD